MLSFIFSLLFQDLKKQYSGYKLQILHIVQDLLVLVVLYQTSQAFSLVKDSGESLFGHLLFGEIVLRLPTMLIFLPTDKMRPWVESGALEYMLGFEGGPSRVILMESLAAGLTQLLRSLLLLTCIFVFLPQYIESNLYARAILVQLVTLPVFIFLGLALMPISLFYRWGRSMLGRFIGVLALFSGGYFPLTNFNHYQEILIYFNPLALYINAMKAQGPGISLGACLGVGIFVFSSFVISKRLFHKRLHSGLIEGLTK